MKYSGDVEKCYIQYVRVDTNTHCALYYCYAFIHYLYIYNSNLHNNNESTVVENIFYETEFIYIYKMVQWA